MFKLLNQRACVDILDKYGTEFLRKLIKWYSLVVLTGFYRMAGSKRLIGCCLGDLDCSSHYNVEYVIDGGNSANSVLLMAR